MMNLYSKPLFTQFDWFIENEGYKATKKTKKTVSMVHVSLCNNREGCCQLCQRNKLVVSEPSVQHASAWQNHLNSFFFFSSEQSRLSSVWCIDYCKNPCLVLHVWPLTIHIFSSYMTTFTAFIVPLHWYSAFTLKQINSSIKIYTNSHKQASCDKLHLKE